MKNHHPEFGSGARVLWLAAGFAFVGLAAPAALPPDVAEALKAVQAYETGVSLKPVKAVETYAIHVASKPAERAELAAALAAALDAPATKPDAVAYLCRELGRTGGAAEVPVLARRLADARHADAARLALEAIPDSAAGAVLREALGRCTGMARIGVMNSLAARADEAAVPALKDLAGDPDVATAHAALHALGRSGTKAAAAVLAGMSGDQATQAKLDCALRLAARGDRDTAAGLVQPLVASGPPALRVAALSTLARVAPQGALPALLAAAAGSDDFVAESAIGILAQAAEPAGAAKMTGSLASLAPRRRALMLDALALRGDAAALPAVRPLLRDADGEVREAAARVLGALGTPEDVDGLTAAAAGGSKAAAAALVSMKADGVDRAILAAVTKPGSVDQTALIEAAVSRRVEGAGAVLADALAGSDAAVRVAAARGLAALGTPAEVPRLLAALRTAAGPVAREIELAVTGIGRRGEAGPEVTKLVTAALAEKDIPDAATASLLRVLAGLGGIDALGAVRSRMGSGAADVRDAAIRALAGWSGVEALPDLLALAKDAGEPVHRALALRGLLRLAPGAPAPLDWLRKAAPLAVDADSKRAFCAALGGTTGPDALRMALDLAKDREVATEAALAAVAIARGQVKRDAPGVEAAMNELIALKLGPPSEPQARALLREAKGQAAAKTMSAAEREARVAALAKELPAGQTIAAYMDCGPEMESPGAGPKLRIAGAKAFYWEGTADAASLSVAFDGSEVAIQVSGLDPKRAYRLALAWWDFDANGRKQSVWVGRDRVVPPTALPSGRSGAGPARIAIDLPGADGGLRVGVKREGNSNAVVGELWLIDAGPASGAPAAPAPAASSPVAPSPAVPAPPPPAVGGERKRVLIATGLEYPGHKWRTTAPLLRDALAADARLAVEVSEDPAAWGASELRKNDAIVLHYMNWENPGPGAAAQENLRAAVSNGTGLVLVHFACGAFQGWPEFVKIAGRVWNPKLRGHDPRGPFRVEIADNAHPVMARFDPFGTEDELYTCLDGDTPIHVLASARSKVDGKDYPMAFVLEYGRGRVFHCVLGHDTKAFEAPSVGALYRRGTAWAAGLKP